MPLQIHITHIFGKGCTDISLNATFSNFIEFKERFSKWCEEGKHIVSVDKSDKSRGAPKEFEYLRVTYRCLHGRQAKPRGTGTRPQQNYNYTGCKMLLKVFLCNPLTPYYKITQLEENHNHSLQHYNLYPQKRLLTKEEETAYLPLIKVDAPTKVLKKLVKEQTGKDIKTKDCNNLCSRYAMPIRDEVAHGEALIKLVEKLVTDNPNWRIHYETNEQDVLQFLFIQTTEMQETLEKYPDILFVDGTYKVNIENYVLYTVMVQDGHERGRAVCYAFLRHETDEIVRAALEKFIHYNSFVVSACKVVMTDKDLNEMNILRDLLPNSTLLLFAFHVINCLKDNVNKKAKTQKVEVDALVQKLIHCHSREEYSNNLAELKRVASDKSQKFYDYFIKNWDSCKEMWAHSYRQDVQTLGNNTNRLESHNHKLKGYLRPGMRLVDAVLELTKFASDVVKSQSFDKLQEMSLNLNVNAIDDFQLELSDSCTVHGQKRILEQYERFNTSQCSVSVKDNSYTVALGSREYIVSHDLNTCTCSSHLQYNLPCAHIFAARQFAGKKLFSKENIPLRWRKDHFLSETSETSLDEPAVTTSIQTRTHVKLDTFQEKYLYARSKNLAKYVSLQLTF